MLNSPLSENLYDLIRDHLPTESANALNAIQALLKQFDDAGWLVEDSEESVDGTDTIIKATINPSAGDLVVVFPDIPYIKLIFKSGGANPAPLPFEFRFGLENNEPFVEVKEIAFEMGIGDPLHPQSQTVLASVVYSGGFKLYTGLKLALTKADQVQLPAIVLGDSGFSIEADGLELDLSKDNAIAPIEQMGLEPNFIGLYFKTATLRIQEDALFPGFPAFEHRFNNLALGPSGVSFSASKTFDVQACLQSGAGGGHLLASDWAFCLEQVDIHMLDNKLSRFNITGQLKLPVLDELFAFQIQLEKDLNSKNLNVQYNIRKASAAETSIKLEGLPFNYPLKSIDAVGTLSLVEGIDAFTIGNTRITFPDIPEVSLSVSDAKIDSEGFSGVITGDFPVQFDPALPSKFKGSFVSNLGSFSFGVTKIKQPFSKNLPVSGLTLDGQLYVPFLGDPLLLGVEQDAEGDFNYKVSGYSNVHIDNNSLVLEWNASSLSDLLHGIVPDAFQDFDAVDVPATFRALWDENQLQEIRADVQVENQVQTFSVPGLKFTMPGTFNLHLIVQNSADNGHFPHVVHLATTFERATSIIGASDFSWMRDGMREINNDQERATANAKPLLQINLTTKQDISVQIMQFDTQKSGLPRFFKQYNTAIVPLEVPVDGGNAQALSPTDTAITGLQADAFDIDLSFDATQFYLPFLKNEGNGGGSNPLEQFIEIQKPASLKNLINFPERKIMCPLGIKLKVGKLEFLTDLELGFNWEDFAFSVNHSGGIDLYAKDAELTTTEFLGLDWRFKGRDVGNGQFHYFTLVTNNYHYQIKQAEESVIELSFTKLSSEPIVFGVTDFAVTPKGISLAAEVLDLPVRLNGIDTRFRFGGTRLEIKENNIQAFTLAGSGPMPPALIGEAMVDVFLQFKQVNGSLTMVEGGAKVQGNEPWKAKSTRFEFRVDALGLRFVNDGKFHLYFLMTGSASFVPLDSDDSNGPLALLSKIKIDFVECPITGDASVIGKSIRFAVELPKKVSFSFLGCFEMELRGIGFIPQCDRFDGDAAMQLSGQVYFSIGGDDVVSSKFDFHDLFIGVPARGSFVPRISMKRLGLEVSVAGAFRLQGVVAFVDDNLQSGFMGEGMVDIKGLPSLAASFAFLRVRRAPDDAWLRAWFIYLEVRKLSLEFPIIKIFLREIGIGFGYRYTIASIKAADQTNDIKELIKNLKALSKTQGNLSKIDSWAVDLEDKGADARWTIVLRALIAQNSASSPLTYSQAAEEFLPCIFLFDAIVAFRSDFTFYMAVRAWFNTNYNDFLLGENNVRERPSFTGFVLLSPRKKRFLANMSSNKDGLIGDHPPLPGFVKDAIGQVEFSVVLLIEPGLFHYEMGWPNNLGYTKTIGPLTVEVKTGFIFRVSAKEIVLGQSIYARGKLEIDFGVDFGFIGARIYALGDVAYGARYIGVLSYLNLSDSALYGAIGLEIKVRFSISFWFKIDLGFFEIKFSFSFSLEIGFTASLEVGLMGANPGVRGRATISVGAMGRSIRLNVKVGINEDAVSQALTRTEQYLNIGLEASDVKPTPGVSAQNRNRMMRTAALSFRALAPLKIDQPNYSIFVVRETVDDYVYFVLFPQGESDNGEEPGFLPIPPNSGVAVDEDFELMLPQAFTGDDLMQYDPIEDQFVARNTKNIKWKVNWNAKILEDNAVVPKDEKDSAAAANDSLSLLRNFLALAFIQQKENNDILLFDPPPLPVDKEKVEDPRVYNPADTAYEAAVRGAVAQFEGSPFFKKDETVEYERQISRAYADDTTIYGPQTAGIADQLQAEKAAHEQADQFRGLITQDIISSVQNYVHYWQDAGPGQPDAAQAITARSVAFQMGLVFKVKADAIPDWLDMVDDQDQMLKIRQRKTQNSSVVDGDVRSASTFNIAQTDFSVNPPQFQRIQHFADTNMIAINWDLVWNEAPHAQCTMCQMEPEHHLQHYKVFRRAIDNSEPELNYTLKNAEVLHIENSILKALQPRFKLVDHFNHESLEQQAELPEDGRTYLYSITPVDFSGKTGRPLSLLVTRYPNLPPLVPIDGELVVNYRLTEELLRPEAATTPMDAALLPTDYLEVSVRWTEPNAKANAPQIPVAKYRLVFRQENIEPSGSYGADALTQEPLYKNLPNSSARPYPTDIIVELHGKQQDPKQPKKKNAWVATIPVSDLQAAGILPAGPNPKWRPEAWKVFFQTESVNKVPSSIIPVAVVLRVEPYDSNEKIGEERLPGHLEWLPKPVRFDLLDPQDLRATNGMAHFPMLNNTTLSASDYLWDANPLQKLRHQKHPAGVRAIRFFWNQAPNALPNYPLTLHAGFDLLQLDIDAHSTETFRDQTALANAVKAIQDVRLAPAEDLYLIPGDTLSTNLWEAWYPSTMCRLNPGSNEAAEGVSDVAFKPWYSWRDSILKWPFREAVVIDLTQNNKRLYYHPFLESILRFIESIPGDDALPKYTIDRQIPPPIQPMNEVTLMGNTAQESDPYGWAILHRFGLSLTFSVRLARTGDLVTANSIEDGGLIALVKQAIAAQGNTELQQVKDVYQQFTPPLNPDAVADFLQHLHVELLFQPGKSVELAEAAADPDKLLAIVQLSLRPIAVQVYKYFALELRNGPANQTVDITLTNAHSAVLITDTDSGRGEVPLITNDPTTAPLRASVTLSKTGNAKLLMRCPAADTGIHAVIGIILANTIATGGDNTALINAARAIDPSFSVDDKNKKLLFTVNDIQESNHPVAVSLNGLAGTLATQDSGFSALTIAWEGHFLPTDQRATLFSAPVEAAARIASVPTSPEREQWLLFKRYAESNNSLEPGVPVITIPTDQSKVADFLPGFMAWTQRFMHHGPFVDTENGLGKVAHGPWLATAYPKAGRPSYTTPDKSGHIRYDHLVEDQWAHNYRFYVRPFGRYDVLWDSFRQSPAILPNKKSYTLLEKALPKPDSAVSAENAGGLDVVLDRIKSVSKPVILYSGRLDQESTPSNPAEPGTTWEVIVAQHPEQALMEKNQTLYRRLAFRQIAFTLIRRFHMNLLGYPASMNMALAHHNGGDDSVDFNLQFVENSIPVIPSALPSRPDGINLKEPTPDDVLALNMPQRIGRFDQNALVLQWEGLPFFFEQQLLLVAQTANTVSGISSIIQSDFHYRSPDHESIIGLFPTSFFPSLPAGITPPTSANQPYLLIPVKRLWDALSPAAQTYWAAENPMHAADGSWRPSALPDLETIYQVAEVFGGNVEVQREYYFNKQIEQQVVVDQFFDARVLGNRLGDPDSLKVKSILHASNAKSGLFHLVVPLPLTPLRVPVKKAYPNIIGDTASRVTDLNGALSIVSGPTRQDVDNILWNAVEPLKDIQKQLFGQNATTPEQRRAFLQTWYSSRYLTGTIDDAMLPQYLKDKISFPFLPDNADIPVWLQHKMRLEKAHLQWTGAAADQDMNALKQLIAQLPDNTVFKSSLTALQSILNSRTVYTSAYLHLIPYDADNMPVGFSVNIRPSSPNALWTFTWEGATITETEKAQLLALESEPDYAAAIHELIVKIELQDAAPVPGTALPQVFPSVSLQRAWPVLIPDGLGAETGIDFSGMVVNTQANQLEWTRPPYHPLSNKDVLRRVKAVLRTQDPLYQSLEALMSDLDSWVVNIPLQGAKNLIRLQSFLSDEESALLKSAVHQVDRETIQLLSDDLCDYEALKKATARITCKTKVSLAPALTTLPPALELTMSDKAGLSLFGLCTEDLETVTGDADLITGMQELLEKVKAQSVRIPVAFRKSAAVEKAFSDAGLKTVSENGQYTELIWSGSMSHAQRLQLLSIHDNEPEVHLMITRLLQQADQVNTAVDIPHAIENRGEWLKLLRLRLLDDGGDTWVKLGWVGAMSTDEQRRLNEWASGLPAAVAAVAELVEGMSALTSPTIPMKPFIPLELASKIQLSATQIAWFDPAQTDIDLLKQWMTDVATPLDLASALQNLMDGFAANPDASLQVASWNAPIGIRPHQEDLPEDLQTALTIGSDFVRWNGYINTPIQKSLLSQLQLSGDEAFNASIAELITAINGTLSTVHFSAPLPKRPTTMDLIPALQEVFVIGKYELAQTGAMSLDEGQALFNAYTLTADRRNAQLLYNCAQRKLVLDRDIRTRSRRGSARPSALKPLTFIPLG